MRKIIASITQKLTLPSLCNLCKQYHRDSLAICNFCLDSIIPLGPACQYCANSLPNVDFLICGACIKQKPNFDDTQVAYRFDEPLRSLIHEFKYHQGLYLAKTLARLIQNALKDEKPECLIPIPMHPSRIKHRGFNQAAVLVKLLSKQLDIPYNLTHCKKMINTAPQAGLNSNERKTNLRHSFSVKSLPYTHVALVDDLLTTGSTANELAGMLKKVGVKRVSVWCCARTI
jgi:ComF family protein